MGYKCTFMDNDIYSAQDVNEAFSHLLSSGVGVFEDSGDTLDDLNAAISELAGAGVTTEEGSCLVVKESGGYKISEGTCIMGDGSQITFDEDGQAIEPENGDYVYLERDDAANTINIVTSATEGGEDTVPLAHIDSAGNVEDIRQFAVSKLVPSSANVTLSGRVTESRNFHAAETKIFDVGFPYFKYIIFSQPASSMYGKDAVDLSDGRVHTLPNYNTPDLHGIIHARKDGSTLVFTIDSDIKADFSFEVI